MQKLILFLSILNFSIFIVDVCHAKTEVKLYENKTNSAVADKYYSSKADLCVQGKVAFDIKAPKGWIVDKISGKNYDVCKFIYREGEDFDSAKAIIYPNIVLTPNAKDPINYFVENFVAENGGKKLNIVNGEPYKDFELRYFNSGAAPHEYELVAYSIYDDVSLIMVLSARNLRDRDEAESAFYEILENIQRLEL